MTDQPQWAWWGSTDGQDVYESGPYTTREELLRHVQHDLGAEDGDAIEIMEALSPRLTISADDVIDWIEMDRDGDCDSISIDYLLEMWQDQHYSEESGGCGFKNDATHIAAGNQLDSIINLWRESESRNKSDLQSALDTWLDIHRENIAKPDLFAATRNHELITFGHGRMWGEGMVALVGAFAEWDDVIERTQRTWEKAEYGVRQRLRAIARFGYRRG